MRRVYGIVPVAFFTRFVLNNCRYPERIPMTVSNDFNNLLLEMAEAVATVTINRPDKLNALNGQTLDELSRCFTALREDASIKVVILRGAGEKAFVAGADIAELAEMDADTGTALARKGQAVMALIENLGKPVIAQVGGFALGGGCELALACTFRYASAKARLGLPETTLGLIPGYGGTQRLARLVGKGRAMEMILTGEMIAAEEAQSMGLVNKVFAREELGPAVAEVAAQLASRSAGTARLALQAVNEGLDLSLEKGCDLEARLFGQVGATADAHEGCAAFLEKRKAEFKS